MVITLTSADIYAIVERSLSVIGKRSVDDNGNLLFKDITLGTREKAIVDDYIGEAMTDLATELSEFVTASTDDTVTVTLPTSHNTGLDGLIQKACTGYCVSYALYSWFTVTAPRIADKYKGDAARQLAAVIRMGSMKKAPESSTDILSTSTDVT